MNVTFTVLGLNGYNMTLDTIAGITLTCGDKVLVAALTPEDFENDLKKYFSFNESLKEKLIRAKKLVHAMWITSSVVGTDTDLKIALNLNGAHYVQIKDERTLTVDTHREWPNAYEALGQIIDDALEKLSFDFATKNEKYEKIINLFRERYPKFLDAVK